MGDELFFLPLGGAEEIGMNLNLYGIDNKWLMVDLGVSFGEDRLPGIDVVMPDPSYIEARRENLLGLVLTHGHEDHLGAVQYLWPRLRCPVYATPFTASLLRAKLVDSNFANDVPIHELSLGARFNLGPFDLEFITVTHSIPEPNALVVRTRLGTVLHTGDFKIDPSPLVGNEVDEDALRRIGDEGVLAMVCDSTNVFESKESGSEGALSDSLGKIIAGRTGRVAITTFASNLARIKTAASIAVKNDRQPVLVGRSLRRILSVARESSYGREFPEFVSEQDASYIPPDKVLLICTGSQGETRGAMARIADGSHPHISLESGDLSIFSSKIIPGNEKPISRLHNKLINIGVEVITEKEEFVHVSGHPSRSELARMYSWVKPTIAVPVHGERRHIREHVKFTRSLQISESVEIMNGGLVRLAPGPAKVVDHVCSGYLAADGNRVIDVKSNFFRERRRLMFNGMVNVVLVLNNRNELASLPNVSSRGVFTDDAVSSEEFLAQKVVLALKSLPQNSWADSDRLREVARVTVRREIRQSDDIKPDIFVNLVELTDL